MEFAIRPDGTLTINTAPVTGRDPTMAEKTRIFDAARSHGFDIPVFAGEDGIKITRPRNGHEGMVYRYPRGVDAFFEQLFTTGEVHVPAQFFSFESVR